MRDLDRNAGVSLSSRSCVPHADALCYHSVVLFWVVELVHSRPRNFTRARWKWWNMVSPLTCRSITQLLAMITQLYCSHRKSETHEGGGRGIFFNQTRHTHDALTFLLGCTLCVQGTELSFPPHITFSKGRRGEFGNYSETDVSTKVPTGTRNLETLFPALFAGSIILPLRMLLGTGQASICVCVPYVFWVARGPKS